MIRTDVPAVQRPQIGDAVDAAGIALLADDQDRQDGGDGLRDDREIGSANSPAEHRNADKQCQQHRDQRHRNKRERQTVERLPEPGQGGDLVPVHEVRDPRRGLDLRRFRRRCLQLEEHRHAIAAQTEENPLSKAKDSGITPAQHKPQGDKPIGEIFAHQVQPERVHRQREDQKQHRPRTAE